MTEIALKSERKQLESKLLDLAFERVELSSASALLLSTLIVVALWPIVEHERLLAWLGVMAVIQTLNYLNARRYKSAHVAESDTRRVRARLVAGGVAAGLCWGSTVFSFPSTPFNPETVMEVFVLPSSPFDPVTVLLMFILAGVAAYASVAMAFVPPLAMAFLACALLPLSIWLLSFGEHMYVAMGLIALGYLGVMVTLSRRMHATACSLIAVSEENQGLRTEQQQTDQRMARFFENAPGFFYTAHMDQDGNSSWPFASAGIQNLFEVSVEEMKESIAPLISQLCADDIEPFLVAREVSRKNLSPLHLEFRINHSLRGERWIELNSLPHREADGTTVWHGFMQDITERKRMAQSLVVREREFRTLVENLPVAVIRYDTECRRSFINPAAEKMLHGTAAELLGQVPGEGGIPASSAMIEHYRGKMEEVLTTGATREFEFVLDALPAEQQEHYEVRFVAEHGAELQVGSVLAIWYDVTERKRVVKHLEETRARLQTVMSTIPDMIWLKDVDGAYLSSNSAHARFFGVSEAEIIGKTDYDFVDAELADFFRNKDREAIKARCVCINEESVIYADDGRQGLLETRKMPVFGGDGNVIGVLGVARDVTERKVIEKALHDSEKMLQEAQRIAHVGSWDVDMLNDKLVWSDEIFRIWEIDKTNFRADFAAFIETVHPEDRERVSQVYNEAVINHTLYEVEHRLLFPDGRVKHILERGEPQYDEQGKPVRFIGTALDITERKQMEYELRLKEDVLDQARIGIYLIDENARITYVNDEACRALGYSREALLAKTIPEIDASRSLDETLEVRQKTLEDGAFTFETMHVRSDGSLLPVEIWASTLEYEGKKIGVALAADISERKRMEQALVERERDFRSLADNIPDNIARWDVKGRYLYINPTHERLLGVAASEMIGKPLPDTHEHVKAALAQVMASGRAVELVRQTVPVNGELQTHEVTLVLEFDAEGRVVSVLGLGRNMTEFYRMQDAIAAREREFRTLAENTPDPIYRYDRDCRRIYVNPAVCKISGKPMEALIGHTPADGMILVSEQNQRLMESICAVFDSGEMRAIMLEFIAQDGEHLDYHMLLIPECDANGQVATVLAMARDVTEMRRLERRQSQFFDVAPGFFYTSVRQTNGQNAMPFASPGIRDLFGLEPADVAQNSEPLLVLFHPDDREQRLSKIEESARNLTRLHYECRINHPQRGERWVEAHSLPQRLSDGSIRWDGFMNDITERKRIEETLRANEEKLSSLFALSPLGIALTDMQGSYVEFNEAFRAICGYSENELMTLDYWALTPRKYEAQEAVQLESLTKTGRYGPYEKEYLQKSGALIPIQLNGMLVTGKDGQQYIWSIVEDISERKKSEAELQANLKRISKLNVDLEQNARDLEEQAVELEMSKEQLQQTEAWYRSILHSAPDGMLIVDSRGLIMQVNAQLEAMFGYYGGELPGTSIEVLIPEAARAGHVEKRNGFISGGDKERRMAGAAKDLFGRRKDGSVFPVDVSLSRLPDLDGRVGAICAAVRDVSERQKVDVARESALSEALRLAQLRSSFLAQMSHELRTPLNGILGYAQNLLRGEALGENQRSGLNIIQHSGEHLLTLINGILDHAAIEAGKFELIPNDIELESFLSTIIGIISVRAEQKSIAFSCDAGENLPAVVRGDAQRLRQVLLNLLSNAVKFTDKGQVILRVNYIAPSRLRFEVQDSGVGIAADQMDSIFLPFEQVGESSRRAGGTGLGLAISRKLVELMGGSIKVESQPNTGSIFSFEIEMAVVQSDAVNASALSERAATRSSPLTPLLFAPPSQEMDILHGLALRGNMRDVARQAACLVELDSRYAPFAEHMRQLAKGFQTKALLGFIAQFRDKKEREE